MVDDVPQSGVPASSVHTGGTDESVGNVGNVGSVGKAGRVGRIDDRIDESPSEPADEVVVVVVALVDDAPALVTPKPIMPRDSDAPNNEATTKR
jgi:hypothetical protein